jgi:hypothetical protein
VVLPRRDGFDTTDARSLSEIQVACAPGPLS